jgi:membrane protease YdiL (CAAX protease family)
MAIPVEQPPSGQLAEGYWAESQRPLASLVFVMPLLIVYEVGVTLLGARQNGADAVLRRMLEMLGFGQHFLLPTLLVCILLVWHYLTHEPWRLSGGVLSGMAVESVFLAVCLRMISFLQYSLITLSLGEKIQDAIGYLGAGIYEELLFRLILLSLLAWVFRRAGATPRTGLIAAAIVSSLLFSAAHHVGPYGEPLDVFRFTFRFVAGMFFSVLFIYRGFGIAAGSHAAYDILVGMFG